MPSFEELRKKALQKVRADVKKQKQREDKLIVEAVQAIDEMDDVFNIMLERIKNWYAFHYPELENIIKNPETYLALVKEIQTKEQIFGEMEKKLTKYIPESKVKKIIKEASNSMGAQIKEKDLTRIQQMAVLALHVKKEREELSGYIEERVHELMPNMHALAGGVLSARLIAQAGSLERLAEMPSSTIQVLGAEKALFAHLRKGTPPPKHGLIYHSPYVIQSSRKYRGKAARALAAKLAIAAREDYFTKEDIGPQLKKDLDEQIDSIRKK